VLYETIRRICGRFFESREANRGRKKDRKKVFFISLSVQFEICFEQRV
jgi:hypothetical protein